MGEEKCLVSVFPLGSWVKPRDICKVSGGRSLLGEKRNEEIKSKRRCEEGIRDRGRIYGLYKGIKSTSLKVQE